ncbi:MAG: pseudouridine synthase [Burkholderiales bacterium]
MMSTLKLKKKPSHNSRSRQPLRKGNSLLRPRTTLAEKEAQDAARPSQRRPEIQQQKQTTESHHTQAASRAPQASHDRNSKVSHRAIPPEFHPTDNPPLKALRTEPQQLVHRPLQSPAQEGIRLSKRMSELGLASRREADDWIAKGWVRVDGKVVNELGSRVRPGQLITIDTPAKFYQARKVTILLNKPIGYVSGQAEDRHEPAWVLIKPDTQWREDVSGIRFKREHVRGLAPAGRLDIDSVGLLVLTQDGRIAKQLIGEESQVEKEYLVRVAPFDGRPPLNEKGLALLNHGLSLDGRELKPAQVEWIHQDQLRFILREGRKRQIRRMCEAVGLKVLGLQRVRIGQVMLGHLPPGQWRYLNCHESFDPPLLVL